MRWASLLRLYPRRWRDRYEDEMSAVLEEGAPSLRDGLDLLRGAIETRLFAASTDEPRHALRGDRMGEVLAHPVPSKSSVVAAALLLLLPATFLLSVTLKYGPGHDSLFDSLEGVWTFRPIECATVPVSSGRSDTERGPRSACHLRARRTVGQGSAGCARGGTTYRRGGRQRRDAAAVLRLFLDRELLSPAIALRTASPYSRSTTVHDCR